MKGRQSTRSGVPANSKTAEDHLGWAGHGRLYHLADLRRNALEAALQRAERREQFRAQHGPVKVLMRDGEPVEEIIPVSIPYEK